MVDRRLSRVVVMVLMLVLAQGTASMAEQAARNAVAGSAAADSVVSDVVYGHKDGMALTFDVFRPTSPAHGAGVLYIESGGWRSRWRPIDESRSRFEKLLASGFTVFVVRHGSAPRYNAHEAYGDVQRAVRFIRQHASAYGVDAERLGVHGGSAGGHLSLMLGLASDAGDPAADDEVLRGSSRVAAVVAYYPPVDLRPQGRAHSDFAPVTADAFFYADGLAAPRAVERWSALDLDEDVAASISPILHVSPDDPPTMLVHGDADVVVDLNASRMMHAALESAGVDTELVVIEGGEHVFPNAENRSRAMDALVRWFEKCLVDRD